MRLAKDDSDFCPPHAAARARKQDAEATNGVPPPRYIVKMGPPLNIDMAREVVNVRGLLHAGAPRWGVMTAAQVVEAVSRRVRHTVGGRSFTIGRL